MSDAVNKTSLESFLMSIRDKCRNKGAQMDENGNIYADLIYDDLLFLKELWMLVESGGVSLDTDTILRDTTITNIRLDTIASLSQGDSAHVSAVFNRLWSELQKSSLASIFDREFALKSILKDEKLKSQYIPLLVSLLDYTGKVQLVEHEDTDPYEYFTKELKKGKSKYYGQFYTPEILTESCVKEINPQFGEIGLDPAAGTGKFMRTASKYVSKNQPEYSEWDAYQHMRMVEIENKIYRQGILGTFIKYKKLPNMANQRKGNSFDLLIKEKEQVDYILANPPYGGTVDGFDEIYNNVSTEQKGKRLVKTTTVKPEVVYPFEFVKKDTCVLFIQLCVNKLKDGGRAAVIFNATLMNDSHRDVIKWFLSKCNLYKMIVNPSGTFKCTGIETYSFIFTKGKPTEKIEYYDLVTSKKIGELTMAQIEQRGWDINPKFQKEAVRNLDYQYVKLGSLVNLHKGTIQATHASGGQYPVISISDKHTHSEYSVDGQNIFIASTSSGNSSGPFKTRVIWFDGKCAVSTLMQCINILDLSKCYTKYLFNLLLHAKGEIELKCEKGSANKSLDKDAFLSMIIPLPPLPIQQEIVATLDRIFTDPQDMNDCLAFTDKAIDLMLKDPSGKLLEDVMVGLRLKRSHLAAAASIKAQMAAIMRSLDSREYEKKKIEDITSLKGGFPFKSSDYVDSGLAVLKHNNLQNGSVDMSKGQDYIKQTNDMENYLLRSGDLVVSMDFDCGKIGKILMDGWVLNQRMTLIRTKDTNIISQDYLYWLLRYGGFYEALQNVQTGTTIKHISGKNIADVLLAIPPIAIQQEILAILNEMESELKAMEQMAAKAEQRAKYILDGYLCSKPNSTPVLTANPNNQQDASVNTLIPVNKIVETTEPAKAKRILKIKKTSSN